MKPSDPIYVAGHLGLIGSAVVRRLKKAGFDNLILKTHAELELTDAAAVSDFFKSYQPKYVVMAAGKVGGIVENKTYPADFITSNLAIQLNTMAAAHAHGVERLVYFASSCMYPRECEQPMAEEALFSGKPEPTSMAYALSKMAGMQMCLAYNQQYQAQRFIPIIPNSAYGPNDNFNPESGHVLSALIRRFHEAKVNQTPNVTLWGTGSPRREFIHADDLADACLMLLSKSEMLETLPLNVGSGSDLSIKELASFIAKVIGYGGQIDWDTSKPDGAPRKLLDSSKIKALGWQPQVDMESGLKNTYDWYLENKSLGSE